MKKLMAFALPIMLLALVLVFFACNNFHTGEEDGTTGSFTISIIGGGNARGMWDTGPANLSDGVAPSMLTHLITVIPNGGDPLTRVIEGSGTVSFTIPVGLCSIVVEGMGPDHVVYSYGSRTVNIVPGRNPDAPITMGPRKNIVMFLIQKNPTNPSYQGCAPDLTGMVVKFFYTDGTTSITTDTTRFSTIPERCEDWLPADAPKAARTFTLYYLGVEANNYLVLPEVLGLVDLSITGLAEWVCYEDNLFEGIVLEGTYSSSNGQMLKRQIPFFNNKDWVYIDEAANKVEYTVADNNNPGPLQPGAITIPLVYANYWKVDRLDYVSGSVTPFTVETVPKQDSVWLMALNDVKLRVIYYVPNGGRGHTREIGMAEYRAAQNLRKASKITIWNDSGCTAWADMAIKPGIKTYACLFYYSSLIDPDTGDVQGDREQIAEGNGAMVPITDSFAYSFSEIRKVSPDYSNHGGFTGGESVVTGYEVKQDTSGLLVARDLLRQLLAYWNVEAVYKSKVDPTAAPITVVYPSNKWAVDGVTPGSNTNIGSVNGLPGMIGLDVTNIEIIEKRSVGIRFELPEGGWETLYFDYYVKP